MTLRFVGIGLGTRNYLTKAAEDALLSSEKVYLDKYTGYISPDLEGYLREMLKERLVHANREVLEDHIHDLIDEAREKIVSIAVTGDPFIATTHISILIEAIKRRVNTELIHGVSIVSAAISCSGLSSYKFGRTVTIPKAATYEVLEGIYHVIARNQEMGLHTLLLLDTAGGGLTIGEATNYLIKTEERMGLGLFGEEKIAVALAHVGIPSMTKKCDLIKTLPRLVLPPPPHVLIIPGELHFIEKEALKTIASCDPRLIDTYVPVNVSKKRAEKYIIKTRNALEKIDKQVLDEYAQDIINVVTSYVEDSKNFIYSGRLEDSLIAISYAEGLLDCLRMLRKVSFEW